MEIAAKTGIPTPKGNLKPFDLSVSFNRSLMVAATTPKYTTRSEALAMIANCLKPPESEKTKSKTE